jgi:hypothetical protein
MFKMVTDCWSQRAKRLAMTILCLGAFGSAHATAVQGQIGNLFVVAAAEGAPGNYAFRVFFATNAVMCNGQNWAYINSTEPNYGALVASILFAKQAGAFTTLDVIQDDAGYCHIGFIVVQ